MNVDIPAGSDDCCRRDWAGAIAAIYTKQNVRSRIFGGIRSFVRTYLGDLLGEEWAAEEGGRCSRSRYCIEHLRGCVRYQQQRQGRDNILSLQQTLLGRRACWVMSTTAGRLLGALAAGCDLPRQTSGLLKRTA